MKFSKKHLLFVFLFIVMILGSFFFYHKQSSNSELVYWEYMINQDPKPKHIPEEEYFLGNQKGMCWRENKVYLQDELIQKAKLQFLLNVEKELNDYKYGRILDASEKNYLDTDVMCQKNPLNCQLYQSKLNFRKKELIVFLGKNPNLDTVLDEVKYFSVQDYIGNSAQTYIARYNNFQEFFPIDCCTIQKMDNFIDFTQSKGGKQFVLLTDKLSEFKNRETVKNLGLNNLLFQVHFFRTHIDVQNTHQFHTNNIYDLDMYQIFILNNCGDIFPISTILNKN